MREMNLFIKQKQTHKLREGIHGYQRGRIGEGIVREFGMDIYTPIHLKWIINKDLLSSTVKSAQYSVLTLRSPGGWMGEGIVRESGMDMDTRLYLTWRTSKDLLASPGNSAQCHL